MTLKELEKKYYSGTRVTSFYDGGSTTSKHGIFSKGLTPVNKVNDKEKNKVVNVARTIK